MSVRHQGLCIGSHFKLINDPLRINLVFPAKIYTFPTEEIYAVHGRGCLNKEVNNKGGIYDVQGGGGCEISGEREGSIFNFLHAGCMNYFLEQPIMPVSESSNCNVQRG